MTRLHWPNEWRFHDRERDFFITSSGDYDVPDDAEEQYLNRGWKPVDGNTPQAPSNEESVDGDDGSIEETFDAEDFVEDTWQSITHSIEDGEVDPHLDEIMAAEEDRDNGGRPSVVKALEARSDE